MKTTEKNPESLPALEFWPPLREAQRELQAVDQRIADFQAREVELNKFLSAAPPPPPPESGTVAQARRILRNEPIEGSTAADQVQAMRAELARLARQIEVLKAARGDMLDRINRERTRASVERFKLADVQAAQRELQAAARVLLQVHRKGLELAQGLQAAGFEAAAPWGWTGAHLPTELEAFIEAAAAGEHIEVPPFDSGRTDRRPFVDRGFKMPRIFRSV